MLNDMPLAELEQYAPPLTQAADFAAFWEHTLHDQASQPLAAHAETMAYPVERVRVSRVVFNGYGTPTRVSGWYLRPEEPRFEANGTIPTLVRFHGYSWNKGLPADHLFWALQGFAVLAIDTRGQDGDTPDLQPYPQGSALGHMTKGIADPQTYYYRFVYMDAVRAVEYARSLPETGAIIVAGGSQGGGMALAAAALGTGVTLALIDVPFLCHFARALDVFTTGPYQELVDHWSRAPQDVARDMQTLSYCDGMNLAPRVTAPTLFSVGLRDTTCPPSTGFATFHHLASSQKELRSYPYNGHEGGGMLQTEAQLHFVRRYLTQQE